MRFILSLLIFAFATSATQAQFGFGRKKSAAVTKVTFVSEVETLTPSQSFLVALKFDHPETWHSYYKNPGTIGLVLEPNWELPDGFSAERVDWPTPHVSVMSGFKTFGYEGSVTHLFSITPPADLTAETVTLTTKPTWQICDPTNCVSEPQNGQPTSYSIKIAVGEAALDSTSASIISEGKKQLPTSTENWKITASDDGTSITLTADIPDSQTLPDETPFYYDEDQQVDSQAEQTFQKTESGFTLTLPRNLSNPLTEEPGPVLDTLTGVLSFEDSHVAFKIDTPLASDSAASTGAERKNVSIGKLLTTLGFMFIGGLILNLMPCVFPVIGLKIMSFVQQAGHDKKKIILHGILFAAGVLVSFWVLAALLFAGGITSWGSQLENPLVIFSLLIIMLLLAMNMYGVFEIGVSATSVGGQTVNKDGLLPTFLSGVLATVIATPCAGPFLGAAIGVAVTLPGPAFFLSFTAMGLGLALPYLFLSFRPDLVEKLPRPGAWMTSFKQGMSFLLFATVGFLLWVYSTQVFDRLNGIKGLLVVLGLTSIALAAWIYGRWSVPGKSARTITIARILAVAFLLLGSYAAWPFAAKPSMWETWSPEVQAKAIAEGRTVYIDFTAKWCVTCQTNKATAYSDEVKKLIRDKNILLLKADKTNPDQKVEAELARLKRSAIPVNVLYTPGSKEPIITPSILTSGYLKDLFTDQIPAEN